MLNDNKILTLIENFLADSKCVIENKQKEYLLKLLGNKKFLTYMLYRGSEDGWKLIDFHSRCDDKGPTISLFKIKDGDIIGGYSKA
jgi:TLD